MIRASHKTLGLLLVFASWLASCDVEVLDVTFETAAAGRTSSSYVGGGGASTGGVTSASASSSRMSSASAGMASATGGSSATSSGPLGGFAGSWAGSCGAAGTPPKSNTSTSVAYRSGMRPSPFCEFSFGARRDSLRTYDDPRKQPTFSSLQFLGVLTGGEDGNELAGSSLRLMFELRPDSSSTLRGKTPVFYAPLIALKANLRDGLEVCGPESSLTLCADGADWIRDNRDYLREVYDGYARDIADVWGTTRPLIWLFEPGFSEYLASDQSAPLSLKELDTVTSDLIGQIRSRLPNALISLHASPRIEDPFEYFGAIDLSLVHMVNVSGAATSDRFGTPLDADNPNATYSNLSAATGLPIFVDTGFGDAVLENHGWLTSDAKVINARISDGVFAVLIEPPPSNLDPLVQALLPKLTHPYCE